VPARRPLELSTWNFECAALVKFILDFTTRHRTTLAFSPQNHHWNIRTIFKLWIRFVSGTPINRLPIMAKQVLDLYELYNLVIARGGLVDVINKKLWQEIIKGLHLPSSITSAAFTLRTQ
jgi:ARID/BRIGHT DNA binding domain